MRSSHRNGLAVLVALSLCFVPLVGQADDLQDELEKLVKDGSARFAKIVGEKFDEVLADAQKGFADAVGKLAAKHIAAAEAKLKTEIAARDKKIADLEARIQRLERELASARKKDEWPARNLSRAYLGVGHTDVPKDLASELKVDEGALVTDVLADGPAAAAGLARGDVIVSINGKAVNSENLSTAIRTFQPGAKVTLAYLRGGKRAQKEVSLVDKEEFWARRAEEPQPVVLGVIIAEQGGALVVKEVEDGFTGGVAGLKANDRLTQVNGAGVSTLEETGAALRKLKSGDRVDLTVVRGGETLTISVVGSHEKGKARLIASKAQEQKPEKKDAPKSEKKEEKKAVVEKPAKKPAYLGVDVTFDEGGAAVISAVLPDTTASAYGLRKGDVFTKLNGKSVATAEALLSEIKNLSAGDKITLVVTRDGNDLELSDVVVGAPGEKVAAVVKPAPKVEKKVEARKPGSVGIVAQDALDGRVLVKSLIEGGAAEKAGLKPEDVIVAANGKAIRNFDDLIAALSGLHAGDAVTFKIRRGDKEDDVKVTLAEKAN